ncbi:MULTISPECIES: lipopolysaccharide N-acetylmannosaminouronosyltransferase [unclassified Lonepinella]|uniref:lipopolysaccharide N-acetylmannosaminouronosyltransferase n=1 Tax=unclassified Lonepinella TaxID=2642006 RepID=UPI0036DCE1EA
MEKVVIREIDILVPENKQALVDHLISEKQIKTGLLIAINAEKMIACAKNPQVNALIQQAEFNYADGISVVFSIKKKYPQWQKLTRIAGIDLWQALLQRSAELSVPVFLIGGQADVVNQVAEKLSHQQVNIVGCQHGYFSELEEKAVIERIKQAKAKFVTVAMGSPKQEIFMQKAQQIYPDCLYMGVGGSFDVLVGKTKRAPLLWRKMNLEWLYRLLNQPTRWQRQLNLLHYAYYYVTNKL